MVLLNFLGHPASDFGVSVEVGDCESAFSYFVFLEVCNYGRMSSAVGSVRALRPKMNDGTYSSYRDNAQNILSAGAVVMASKDMELYNENGFIIYKAIRVPDPPRLSNKKERRRNNDTNDSANEANTAWRRKWLRNLYVWDVQMSRHEYMARVGRGEKPVHLCDKRIMAIRKQGTRLKGTL